MITILLEKILLVLTSLMSCLTDGLVTVKEKLNGISELIIRNIIITDTDTIEFNTDLTEKLCKCKISFDPIQAGSGTPSPDNVRPISGYDSISIAVLDAHDPDVYTVKEIEFDNTVYSGEVDVIGGSGTSEMGIITYNGSEDWQRTAGGSYYINNSNMKSGVNMSGVSNIFEVGQDTKLGTIRIGNALGNTPNQRIYFVDDGTLYADVTAWKTFLESNNLQVCYPLATPTEITITPEDITSIEGDNVITTNDQITSEDINTKGIEVCYFETVNNYFKNKEV